MTKEIAEGRAVDIVHTDFSKTFQTVPHGRLNQKIKVAWQVDSFDSEVAHLKMTG